MKITIIVLTLSSALYSANLVVKDSNVTVSINETIKEFKAKDSYDFEDGSIICFKNGKGRVIVNESKQLSITSKGCIETRVKEKSSFSNLLSNFKNSFIVSFSNSNESIVNGVSSKGLKNEDGSLVLNVKENQKNLVIYSESSGPLPITLNVKNENGKIIYTILNEEDENTLFVIEKEMAKDGYSIEIVNAFGFSIKKFKVDVQ